MSVALGLNYSQLVEQLFLDISLNDVLNRTAVGTLLEPWATMYVDSVLDSRFGDAVWARYHIFGGVHDGRLDEGRITVLESIKEDAIGYRFGSPEQYFEALPFYQRTSNEDGHPDVIQIILDAASEDIPEGYGEDEEEEEL
ncbi:hypothetical protein B0T10DRAFT_561748 [Thelonectria olida]|uniref:Uncharacterized protein n=1 Tax=Thelonectria olida TaxID=1576542 RepID=A0A9P8W3Z5_9HYPO|nr:hypothetical protein B0T10DRAFT_561748 [Thelonectria olida]